jgi:hypothetical protein
MRHFKNEEDDEDHYFLGRVVFVSDRIFARSHRKAGCHQPFDFFKIGETGEACEEFTVPWCGFALETERVFAGSFSGEVMGHAH